MNNIYLSQEDMPYVQSNWTEDPSKDETSKVVQRVAAIGFMPLVPEIINENFAQLGYKYRVPKEIADDPEKWKEYMETYMPKATSRSGDGMAAGGVNGTSSNVSGSDNSTSNNENA